MIKLHRILLAGAVLALASTTTQAAAINAGLSLAGINVTQNGANLSVSTTISAADTIVSGPGTGAMAGILAGTSFGAHAIDLTMAASGFGVMLTNATWGTFTATSGTIIQETSGFLSLFVTGTLANSTDSGPASLRISVNQSGSNLSEAITLNAPPVPEPASIALAGIGLAAAGLVGLRKRSV